MTDLDRRTLHMVATHPGIGPQELVQALGLRRACGAEFHAQGAGRIGAGRGMRLVTQGLAIRRLIHGGYCYGFWITPAGATALGTGG